MNGTVDLRLGALKIFTSWPWGESWNFMKLPGGGGKGIRMSKNKEELEQNFVQVQHLGRFFFGKKIFGTFLGKPPNIHPILPYTNIIYCNPYFWYVSSGYVQNPTRISLLFLLRSEVPGSPVFMMQLCILEVLTKTDGGFVRIGWWGDFESIFSWSYVIQK